MHFFTFATMILSALALVSGIPIQRSEHCNITLAKLSFPDTQSISVPDLLKPKYIALAIGTQNYTCSNTGTYNTEGALSTLVDLSCVYQSDSELFKNIQDSAYNLLLASGGDIPSLDEIEDLIGSTPYVLGEHYFTPQDSAIAPVFDFSKSQEGKVGAFVVGRQVGGITSPEGSQNIDWLQLQRIDGHLAKYVFRVDTRGGQPPQSCNEIGQSMTVPYSAKYWFFK